jgi:hypothetical protein
LALALAFSCRSTSAGDIHPLRKEREIMVERALRHLAGQVADGRLGDSRPKAVSALYILAALSAGVEPGKGPVGTTIVEVAAWLRSQEGACLGDAENPHSDHVLAALALQQMTGEAPDREENLALFRKSLEALQYTLDAQDKGMQPAYTGGWSPQLQGAVNDRMLSAWFLWQLRGADLWQARVGRSALRRGTAFVLASQKPPDAPKPDERGGFSVGPDGLAVASASAAGGFTLALFGENDDGTKAVLDWLNRHPPRWFGPDFFNTNVFASRALWRARHLDDGAAFVAYSSRLARLLRERQSGDGSFPFPPGHGGPALAMGTAYSTAMAVLMLTTDFGHLPMDQ